MKATVQKKTNKNQPTNKKTQQPFHSLTDGWNFFNLEQNFLQ